METKPDIQMYTLGSIAEAIAKTGTFDFGGYEYVATIAEPEAYERLYHFDLGNAEVVVAGMLYSPKPDAYEFFSVYMDQCIAFSEDIKKFLKLNLTAEAYANLNITKIKKAGS